ncbi:transposase family protein [Leptotrichia sp. HSP-342]|uniref:Transposase family protein n=1 Tax=Leptotrichia mesophila TaxID=3239303 RepID=A0AB39VCR9_9FUSO
MYKRQTLKIKHKLCNIIVITLFVMLTNVEYWEEIEEFEKLYLKALKRYLEISFTRYYSKDHDYNRV